jgi:hypothetical protein
MWTLKVLRGPAFQLLIQIGGGVGKRTEDDDLAVGFAPVVGAGLGDFVLDDGLSSASLASRSGIVTPSALSASMDSCCLSAAKSASQRSTSMCSMRYLRVPTSKASRSSSSSSASIENRVACNVFCALAVAQLLVGAKARFQVFNLADGALHGDGEDLTELSSRLRKFTFIMPIRNFSRFSWLKLRTLVSPWYWPCIGAARSGRLEQSELVLFDLFVQVCRR